MKRVLTLCLATLLICPFSMCAFAADVNVDEKASQSSGVSVEAVTATSELVEDGLKYSAENAVDGNPATCWAEGAEEYGIGESITLFLPGTYNISEITIIPGWAINTEFFDRNAKPKEIRITTSSPDEVQYITLEESASPQSFELDLERVGWVTFEIGDIYEGTKGVFDTCISEIALYGIESLDDPETRFASMFEVAESLAEVEQNYEEAFKWYKMSAEGGYAPAQNVVGLYLLKGDVVTRNAGAAIKWLKKAADQHYPEAQYHLASLYERGYGVQKSSNEALKLYKRASYGGYAPAQYTLGLYYEQGIQVSRDYVEAVKWYKLAAEQGDVNAQLHLGMFYEEGYAVRQDYEEAAWWYKQSADQGNAEAQYRLGVYYETYEDYGDAAVWYAASAYQGFPEAQCSLGVLYREGNGVEQNDAKALELFSKAAERGNSRAEYWMGIVYMNGYGVEQDIPLGTEWLKKAAEKGLPEAKQELVDYYSAL